MIAQKTLNPAALRQLSRLQECSCVCSSVSSAVLQGQRRYHSVQPAGASATSTASASAASTSAYPASSSSSSTSQAARIAQASYRQRTALPKIKDQRLLYFGVAGIAVSAWTLFVMWAMSAEKASSSVMKTITFNLRTSPLVQEALGEGIRPKPFLRGEPWVHGKVNTIQGIVDINFRVVAADGREGTVYFRSERPNKAGRFETKEFKLLVDGSKQPIDLMHMELRT